MPIHFNGGNVGTTLDIHCTGKSQKWITSLAPEFERLVAQHGKLGELFDVTGFQGWEVGTTSDEIRFDIKNYADIERLATVGD